MAEGNNYPNPLDNFRSYSYHYIMCIANTTEAFRKMINSDQPLWSRVNSVRLGDEINLNGDRAWLVLDTRRFSQFSIVQFETEHAYGTGDRLNPSVPVTDCAIKIIDTTGLTFFPFLVDLMQNKVKSTRASSFFLLNIVFVGHRDDGTSETISTCYLPLLLAEMGFEFNVKGSTYQMSFFEILGGTASRGHPMQELNDLGVTQSISSKSGTNNLKGMIQSLEDALNKRSLEFYQTYVNKTASKNGTDIVETGKLVQYMINIPSIAGTKDDWSNFKISSRAKSTYEEQHFIATPPKTTRTEEQQQAQAARDTVSSAPFGRAARAKAEAAKAAAAEAEAKKQRDTATAPAASTAVPTGIDESGQLAFSPNMKVTDAITQILMSCEELLEMGSKEKREAGEAVLYKILTSITSDDTSYIVHYDVVPYYAPKISKDENNNATDSRIKDSKANRVAGQKQFVKNLIHYDYVFTGLNSHIENLQIQYSPLAAVALDMNLQLGSARLAKNAAAGGNTAEVEKASKPTTDSGDSNPLIRPGDPIFATTKTLINSSNASGHSTEHLPFDKSMELIKKEQEYNITMAKMHFLGSIELAMSIRGNPNLLRKYADIQQRGSIARHSVGAIISSDQIKSIARVDSETTKSKIATSVSTALDSARSQYVKDYYNEKIRANTKTSGDDALLNGIDPASLPIFVEINIKAPNVDWTGQTKLNSNNEEEALFANYDTFYDGVYQVLTIKHRLADGKFEQEMILIPYDVDGQGAIGNLKNSEKTEGKTPVPPVSNGPRSLDTNPI